MCDLTDDLREEWRKSKSNGLLKFVVQCSVQRHGSSYTVLGSSIIINKVCAGFDENGPFRSLIGPSVPMTYGSPTLFGGIVGNIGIPGLTAKNRGCNSPVLSSSVNRLMPYVKESYVNQLVEEILSGRTRSSASLNSIDDIMPYAERLVDKLIEGGISRAFSITSEDLEKIADWIASLTKVVAALTVLIAAITALVKAILVLGGVLGCNIM